MRRLKDLKIGQSVVIAYGRQLVIVDVQKSFHISKNLLPKLLDYMRGFDDIVYIYDQTADDIEFKDMFKEMKDSGVHVRMKKIAKEFGFLRSMIDTSKFKEKQIITLLKRMIKFGHTDSRDLDFESWQSIVGYQYKKDDYETYNIYIPDDLLDELKKIKNRPILVGGGREECLKEIELLLEALNKKPEVNEKFTY